MARLDPEQMLRMYEAGDSLRVIARRDGRTYEGVRKVMLSVPDGAARIDAVKRAREDARIAGHVAREQQKRAALKRSRTSIPRDSVIYPPLPPPLHSVRPDRIPDDVVRESLREFLLDPDAEGRSTTAYDRWRERRGKSLHPSSGTAIQRCRTWVSAKHWALQDAEVAE